MNSLVLQNATRALVPLLLIYSIFVLFRGHNHPGGGFLGGLLSASAFVLYGLAYGVRAARRLLRVHPLTLIGAGLLLALASGCAGLLLGRPFLTALWTGVTLPEGSEFGSVLFFDLGVYLMVLGAALLILLTLAED